MSETTGHLFSLRSLRERAEDGHADLGDETSCIVGGDELSALLEVVDAASSIVFKREADDTVNVVSGLERLEEAVQRFVA